ncbi:bifunctional serine/threonine-protein kinase/ABC transporter substrate-binding protein, partial [Streptomyces hainanensis]
LLGRLGAGGMGVVYLGRSPDGALVACKVIRPELVNDPELRARFAREVAAARRVASPWAVPVLEADPDAASPWLVSPCVLGPALTRAVEEFGPLPLPSVRALGRGLAEALAVTHEAGLVHRDVKPGNVLLAHDGPRLIDFGLARGRGTPSLTHPGAAVGTPGYLAPEQAQARADLVGPATDVFALGCVLAHAVTGRRPFGHAPVAVLLYRSVHEAPDLDRVPSELRPLLESCLAKAPGERPDTAEIHRALGGGGVGPQPWPKPVDDHIARHAATLLHLPETPKTEVVRRAPPRPRRRRLLAGGLGAALAAAGGGVGWLVTRDGARSARATAPPTRTVAVHADLSGPGRGVGAAQESGARLAVEELNARADVPFRVELLVRDDGGDPAEAVRVAAELAADSSVLAVIGPTADETALAAAATYDDAGLPFLTVSVGADDLTATPHESHLATRPTDHGQNVPLLACLTRLLSARRVALVHHGDTGGPHREIVAGVSGHLARLGGVATLHALPGDRAELATFTAALLADAPDALVLAGPPGPAAALAGELRRAGFDGARLATEPVLDPRFPAEAGVAAEGWIITASFTDPPQLPAAEAFVTAYRNRFEVDPPYYAVESYDTAHFLAGALTELAAADVTRISVTRRLPRTSHRGVARAFAYDPNLGSVPADPTFYLYRVQDAGFRFLGPYDAVTDLDQPA